jgi:benzil reductase ((S)-benzoin forming)
VLLHNAATIAPLGIVGNVRPDDIARAVAVNLLAVMILTNAFLAVRLPTAVARIILVSSRAAEIAKAGQSVYCATKSGAERYLEAVALETATNPRLQSAWASPSSPTGPATRSAALSPAH